MLNPVNFHRDSWLTRSPVYDIGKSFRGIPFFFSFVTKSLMFVSISVVCCGCAIPGLAVRWHQDHTGGGVGTLVGGSAVSLAPVWKHCLFFHLWTTRRREGWIGRLASHVIIIFSENGAGKPLHALHRLVTLYCILLISQICLCVGEDSSVLAILFFLSSFASKAQQAKLS